MATSISELIAALPVELPEDEPSSTADLQGPLSRASMTPVPIGQFRRLTTLGTLQAKIGAAYLFHWLRGWFKSAEENQRLLAETHWRTALRLLDSMSYLRGAAMKVGQTLANFPDIAPREVVETLERLHYDIPPMHWSLLREMVAQRAGRRPGKAIRRIRQARVCRRVAGPGASGAAQDRRRGGRKDSIPWHRANDSRGLPQLDPIPAAGAAHEGLGERQGPVRRPAHAAGTGDRLRAGGGQSPKGPAAVSRGRRHRRAARVSAVLDVASAHDGAARRRAHRRVSGPQSLAGRAQRVRPEKSCAPGIG